MNEQRRTFSDLLIGLQKNKLSIADIVQALNERGPVQGPMHKAELTMVDQALASGTLDERLHRVLTSKMKDVQTKGSATNTITRTPPAGTRPASPPPGDNDQTQVAAGGDRTALNPASQKGDATQLNPSQGAAPRSAPGKPPAPPAGDATVVNTAGSAGAAAGAGGDGFDLLLGTGDENDATQMEEEARTGFKPKAGDAAVTGRSATGGTGGPSTSSWNRVAATGGPEREVHAGDVLKDRFYLDKEVGRGGMGIVFKARDERKVEAQDKNPWVAVKVLNPEFRKHPQALVALQRESRKAQQLTHDNILRVYDFDKDGTVIYMTMEYVDGGSLKDVIKKHPNGMPFDKGWPIIAGLANGLGRAHRDNIVHSDFKPGNVMMTSDMVPKLFDMGIARAAKSGAEAKGETTVFDAGELGALTPAYASLEMIQGQPPELIDDIYALGITAYEILTGKHPFNKKNAEQVMKEGLKPPVVPGLSRKQRKTLEASVAFKRADRVRSCEEFLAGMRKQTAKDFALPAMIGVVVVILALVGVFGGLLPYLKNKRIDAAAAQFSSGAFGEDTQAAVSFLATMDPQEAEATKQKYSAAIQDYFFKVANQKWDIEAKPPKYRFTEASAILDSVKTLFPDSARVATEVSKLTDEKNEKLKQLRDEYAARYAAGLIYEDKPGNVVETLGTVALIDPQSDLLTSRTLPLRYEADIRRAMDVRDYERVAMQVATAIKAFPKDAALKSLAADTKAVREAEIAKAKERELQAKMTAAQAKDELVKLAAAPDFTSQDWQAGVNVAMSKLTGDTTPETMATKGKLADMYAQHIGQMTSDKQLASAQLLAESAMRNFPGAANLMKEVGKLTEARKAYEAEQAKAAALARVDDLKAAVLNQARGGDTSGAMKALNELKGVVPNDPFLASEAPKALADAFLKSAERQAAQNRFDSARRFVAEGLKVAPDSQALKDADKKYAVDGSVAMLNNGAQQPASAKGEELKSALETLRNADSARADKLAATLQTDVLGRLQALSKSDPSAAARGKAEWLKVFPQNAQLAALVIQEAAAPSTQVASATAPTPSLPAEARKEITKAPRVRGQETCFANMSTFGKSGKATCQDSVNGEPGPKLVVIPNPAGGVMAMTKFEITNGQFDAFCKATGKCKASGAGDTLPRANVSAATAKAYAAWLTETTGFTYRLPTEGEWAAAANAGGAGAGEDFNCVLMQGGNQIKGGLPVPVNSGRPNPWGLVNIVGNVAEITEGGSARGGSFNVPMSQCTVEWRGSASETDSVGVRLVREMGAG